MSKLRARGYQGTVITASAGNHGLGVAAASLELGMPAAIYVPAGADSAKLAAIRATGPTAELRPVDGSYDDTERAAREASAGGSGGHFLSSYNDASVVAGQGTIALELLDQWPEVEAVVAPVGGGGLISGLGVALGALAPQVKLFGVEPEASPAMSRSLAAGRITPIADGSTSIAEGLVGNLDSDAITFELARRYVSEIVLVSESEIADAVAAVYLTAGLVVEPSAAAAVAAVPKIVSAHGPRRVACVLTGRNISGSAHRELVNRSLVKPSGYDPAPASVGAGPTSTQQ
jgi:threonine dehydratase